VVSKTFLRPPFSPSLPPSLPSPYFRRRPITARARKNEDYGRKQIPAREGVDQVTVPEVREGGNKGGRERGREKR